MKPRTLGAIFFSLLTSALQCNAFDNDEPPINTYLANSHWPMPHRNPYAQASSPYAGPVSREDLSQRFALNTGPINITLAFDTPHQDGSQVVWGSNSEAVYKFAIDQGEPLLIDKIAKPERVGLGNATTGAYTLVDRDGVFFVPGNTALNAYGHTDSGNIFSPIRLLKQFHLPADMLNDPIVGINMTYDGYIALATQKGRVLVVDRGFSRYYRLDIGDGKEEVSNSIAVDEKGGIYVVTSKAMYRVQWTGSKLSLDNGSGAWRAAYETGDNVFIPGRLGYGSGSTPTLMGVGQQDKFVVITDGQAVTHMVLFWRDAIPANWQPIAPGKDRRIAAELAVDYGDPERALSASEQSVLVRGYGAVVVSNDYGVTFPFYTAHPVLRNLFNGIVVYFSNLPWVAPHGVEKFEWNPATRQLEVAWVNNKISCPNGIPAMSASSNLMYCVGQRRSVWNIEALDWSTGEAVFYQPMKNSATYNSFYAATQIGPNKSIWSGSYMGLYGLSRKN